MLSITFLLPWFLYWLPEHDVRVIGHQLGTGYEFKHA